MTSQDTFSMTDQEISKRLATWQRHSNMPSYCDQMIKHLLANKPAPEAFTAFYIESAMTAGESEIVLIALADNLAALRATQAVVAGR
jgi:hypothetical protein